MQSIADYLSSQEVAIAQNGNLAELYRQFLIGRSSDTQWDQLVDIPPDVNDITPESIGKKLSELKDLLDKILLLEEGFTASSSHANNLKENNLREYLEKLDAVIAICTELVPHCNKICHAPSLKDPDKATILESQTKLRDAIKGISDQAEKLKQDFLDLQDRRRNLVLGTHLSYKKYKAARLLAKYYHPEHTENAYAQHYSIWDMLKSIKKYLSYLASGWRISIIITTVILAILVNFAAEAILIIGLSSAVFALVIAFYEDYKKGIKHTHNKNINILAKILKLDKEHQLKSPFPDLDFKKQQLTSSEELSNEAKASIAHKRSTFKKAWILLATFLGFTWTAYAIPTAAIYIGILLKQFPATWIVSGITVGTLGIIFAGTAVGIGVLAFIIKACFLYYEEKHLIDNKNFHREKEYKARKIVNEFKELKPLNVQITEPQNGFIHSLKAIGKFFNAPLKRATLQSLSWAGMSFLLSKMILFGIGFILGLYGMSILPGLVISLPIGMAAFAALCVFPYKYLKHRDAREKIKNNPELQEDELHCLNQILLGTFNRLTKDDKRYLYQYNQQRYVEKLRQKQEALAKDSLDPKDKKDSATVTITHEQGYKKTKIAKNKSVEDYITKYAAGVRFFKSLEEDLSKQPFLTSMNQPQRQ